MRFELSIDGLNMSTTLNHLRGEDARKIALAAFTRVVAQDKASEVAEGATQYTLRLDSCGDRKIDCIKTIRQYLGNSLLEAKNLAEGWDSSPLLTTYNQAEVMAFSRALDACGATSRLTMS